MKIILHWIILTAAVFISAYFVAGVHVSSLVTAAIVAACIAFINFTVKPIIEILTLPITIITFGLFSFILNAAFFCFVAQIITGFSVSGFAAAFWGALLVSV